jgi:proteasome lid subunit RPN8/RPN11
MNERQVAAAARTARAIGLGIVAQVHSHPGADVRHSDGDDDLVLMPFEGMFSIVISGYGEGSLAAAGVHQFQDGRWCQLTDPEATLVMIPTVAP